jgi:hypothetical protein
MKNILKTLAFITANVFIILMALFLMTLPFWILWSISESFTIGLIVFSGVIFIIQLIVWAIMKDN